MAQVVFPDTTVKDATENNPAIAGKLLAFIKKLRQDDTTPGLHIEPINGARDTRVRTGRVDDGYRAVMFKLEDASGAIYVLHGVWNHDDANKIAENITVTVNTANGVTEIRRLEDAVEESTAEALARAERERAAALAQVLAVQKEAETLRAVAESTPTVSTTSAADGAATTLVGSVVVPAQDPAPTWPDGISVAVLRDELGIDSALAAAALAATTESGLLTVGEEDGTWQGQALVDLATGSTLEQVREAYGLLAPADVPTEPSDADLILGLRTPAARSSFTWIETDEDLRKAIDGLSYEQWQLFLHPQQRSLVERRTNGAMRVSGGAGTGKTVVAVHRAAFLARRDMAEAKEASVADPRGEVRMLLTTYTKNLAEDLRRQLTQLAPELPMAARYGEPGVLVSGLDKVAHAVLQKAGEGIADVAEEVIGRRRTNVLGYAKDDAWEDVLLLAGDSLPEQVRSADFLESEYEYVVLPQKVTSLQAYLRVRRPGRGVKLTRDARAAVWKAIETYRDRTSADGMTSLQERLVLAAAWLDHEAAAGNPRPYRHVLVDEGQDLKPGHLRLLRALVEPGPDDLFIAEDSHQRIYGKKLVLSHYGIEIRGRSRRLTRNYRTTHQNLSLAFGILEPGTWEDLEGQAEQHHYVSPRSGPAPVLLPAASAAEELDEAATLIRLWLDDDAQVENQDTVAPESIAILVATKYQRSNVVSGLESRGVEVRAVDRDAVPHGKPVVMTMHRAKGLEFRKVLLFGVSEDAIPRALRGLDYADQEKSDALLRERSLLYVAATRARDELAISWSGKASPLLEAVAEV